MKFSICFILLIFSQYSFSVVKRDDVPEKNYEVIKSPEYLINMPHEGHGVLIAPKWIVTVAHVIFYDYKGKKLKIGNKDYQISKVIIHPDYTQPDESLFKGDAKPLMDFFKSRSDIALIKLSSSVSDVNPVKVYDGTDEQGQIVTVYGQGATGNGLVGEIIETKPLKTLNLFQNIIEKADGNWLSYKFDNPSNALALEGMHGSGDSGGPSIIYKNNRPYLAGLSSWQFWKGDLSLFKGGLYGSIGYQVRISSYRKWIYGTLKSN
jgi:trypsin